MTWFITWRVATILHFETAKCCLTERLSFAAGAAAGPQAAWAASVLAGALPRGELRPHALRPLRRLATTAMAALQPDNPLHMSVLTISYLLRATDIYFIYFFICSKIRKRSVEVMRYAYRRLAISGYRFPAAYFRHNMEGLISKLSDKKLLKHTHWRVMMAFTPKYL